ncbi:MAG: hypothetical protein GY787_28790 [Alteromonadales bacterium]|nr:hypothetical protein [Alteromonadales bacterium]
MESTKKHLDYLDSLQTTPFLKSIEQFENSLLQLNLSQTVLQNLKRPAHNINIVNWQNNYKDDFKRLNLSWLNSKFNGELTDADKQSLDHPESYYLAQGVIFFSLSRMSPSLVASH